MKYILIVEDHSIVRLATLVIIRDLINPLTALEASNFPDALATIAAHPVDLVLLDIGIPGGEGFSMVERIRRIRPGVRILMFSGVDESLYAIHYLKAGANGFISKNAPVEEIRNAIASVVDTGRYVSRRVQELLLHSSFERETRHANPLDSLSQRELEVMDMMLDGKWTKEIATRLNITGSSVSTYKSRIFEKIGVTTVIELYQRIEVLKKEREEGY